MKIGLNRTLKGIPAASIQSQNNVESGAQYVAMNNPDGCKMRATLPHPTPLLRFANAQVRRPNPLDLDVNPFRPPSPFGVIDELVTHYPTLSRWFFTPLAKMTSGEDMPDSPADHHLVLAHRYEFGYNAPVNLRLASRHYTQAVCAGVSEGRPELAYHRARFLFDRAESWMMGGVLRPLLKGIPPFSSWYWESKQLAAKVDHGIYNPRRPLQSFGADSFENARADALYQTLKGESFRIA